MKIGFFGGTFDPIHEGHLQVARCARDEFSLERIFFIPASRSPHKTSKPPVASGTDRLQMIQRAIEDEPAFKVSDTELKRGGVSYSVDTIEEFNTQFPRDDFFLILGADSFRYFSTWKHPEKIESRVQFLVAPRPGLPALKETPRVHGISMSVVEVSSSHIRQYLCEGRAIDKAWMPEKVLNYIRKHGLYQEVGDKK